MKNLLWYDYNEGKTIGMYGSENGIVVMDEEHTDGIRITLEKNGTIAPWSITCGIYGSFFHTAFAETKEEAEHKYQAMKLELETIVSTIDSEKVYELMKKFSEFF